MPFHQNSLNSSRKPVEETLLPSVRYWVEVVFKESLLKKNIIDIILTIILHPGFQPNVRGAL